MCIGVISFAVGGLIVVSCAISSLSHQAGIVFQKLGVSKWLLIRVYGIEDGENEVAQVGGHHLWVHQPVTISERWRYVSSYYADYISLHPSLLKLI